MTILETGMLAFVLVVSVALLILTVLALWLKRK